MAGWAASRRLWRTRAGRSNLRAMARITIDIPDELAAQLASAAAMRGQTPEAVMETALLLFTEQAAGFDAFLAEGVADAAAGRVLAWEELRGELAALIAQAKPAKA